MRWIKRSTLASLPSHAGLGFMSRNSSRVGELLTRGIVTWANVGGAGAAKSAPGRLNAIAAAAQQKPLLNLRTPASVSPEVLLR